tara:strand:- start:3974 stop:4873 length:900 start_codon:yes stop_codon:yes gene_type:complete
MNNFTTSREICQKALRHQMSRNSRVNNLRHPYLLELDRRYYESLNFINYHPKKGFFVDMFPSSIKVPRDIIFEKTKWSYGSFLNINFNQIDNKNSLINRIKNAFYLTNKKKIYFPNFDNTYTFANHSFDYIQALSVMPWAENTNSLIDESYRLLNPGGLFGFTSFGPETLKSFKSLLNTEKKSFIPLIDLHDLGDFCISAGFADPVVASHKVFFKYKKPETALKELRIMSGNSNKRRDNFLRGKDWYRLIINTLDKCRDSDGNVSLEFELIYGHAWKTDKTSQSKKSNSSMIEKKINFL